MLQFFTDMKMKIVFLDKRELQENQNFNNEILAI